MTFSLVGVFLALCAVVAADYAEDVATSSMDALDAFCRVTAGIVKLAPVNYPEVDHVSFELRTPCKRISYPVEQAINITNAPEFDAAKKTIVFVSGWFSQMNDTEYQELTKAVLCRAENNFIKVNTYTYLDVDFVNSAYNTGKLGEIIALGLKNMNISASNIHLVGHSFGAHVVGSAARHYATLTGNKIARVTGLDPTNPCFKTPTVFPRLNLTDATFVDLVHTTPNEMGTGEVLGHADFFPNGLNATQPGCFSFDLVCSHMRSIHYFTETVYRGNENNFMSIPCDNYEQLSNNTCAGAPQVPMGYAALPTNHGIFYLTVNPQEPYGKNSTSDEYLNLDTCGDCQP